MPAAVVLVGPPGAGKSTVGVLLAEQLGVPLRDTDADIEAAAGAPIADIFIDEGESGFREREASALSDALAAERAVVVVGGGAVTSEQGYRLMADEFVVYLSVGAAEAAKRVGITGARPLLLGNVRTRWTALMKEREPLYREVASRTIATDERTPDEIAAEILTILPEETP